jgi:hypothetical protein
LLRKRPTVDKRDKINIENIWCKTPLLGRIRIIWVRIVVYIRVTVGITSISFGKKTLGKCPMGSPESKSENKNGS